MIVKLQEVLSTAFEKEGIDPSLAVVVSSERPELGDLQCNGVRAAAGRSKQDPHALAERIISHIDHPEFAFKVTGPGFISITVMPEALERRISDKVEATLGTDRIVLDFGGPNIAKPMHIGHLRSLVIGDALQRILSFAGHEVISDIHLGDWGLQMGLLCASLEGTPLADITIELLERTYPMASARKDTDPEFRAKAEDYTLRLQKGDLELRTMWQRFVQVSMVEIERELSRLNITFTCYKGESDSNELITPTIERFMMSGPCEIEDGAVVVHATKPPLILRKSNGAALYATTDLATIWDRMETLEPDRIIYVTDERQQLHFKQVFAAAQAVDLAPASVLTHIWFGTINDSTGKPLKTRAGGVPKLVDVIEAAVAKAAERNPEVAEAVAIAALKFADLQNARTTSYNFDLNRFLSFEGKTGPYMLYQVVRIKSILTRAVAPGPIKLASEAERQLGFKLVVGFQQAIRKAVGLLSPKEVADHAYDIAQSFSKLYAQYPIADDPSRVALAQVVLTQLECCLHLLGIQVVDRM